MFFFHCSIISFQPLTKLKSVMWFTHLNYIIAPGFCFCHHPSERQDQEESSQISVVCSHPTTWASASHPLANSKVILKSFKNFGGFGHCTSHITQLQLKACIGHCEAMMQSTPWLAAKLSSHELYPLWPQVWLWITSGKNSCDGWWLPRYKLIWVLLNIDLFPHVFYLPHLVETSLRRLGVPHIQGDITINRRLRLAPLVGSDLSCHCLVTQCHLNELNCVAMVCWFQFWWLFKLQTS